MFAVTEQWKRLCSCIGGVNTNVDETVSKQKKRSLHSLWHIGFIKDNQKKDGDDYLHQRSAEELNKSTEKREEQMSSFVDNQMKIIK